MSSATDAITETVAFLRTIKEAEMGFEPHFRSKAIALTRRLLDLREGLEARGAYTIRDEGGNGRHLYVADALPAAEDDELWEGYLADARKLVDKLSKDYTPLGIEMLIAALLYEARFKKYRGKHSVKHWR